ncbi:hypothetical protein FE773_07075 [Caminibacter mediatlanticus TB-2]|uniref:Preprotein translocase subunit SecA n=1 Tax=Caminibacter mediatlanticus TB-2 TaxID=391592 RepID=A0ABX5V9M9_9BACT|nr:SEC-C metal-binding domain-containing protein [Caminibacter mediatlanticus]QCT94958.1 hypothetical protein FE773_07075 [Caminibacter mediatlanticus TB-2]
MIIKLPKKEDPFKEYIERITSKMRSMNTSEIGEVEQMKLQEQLKENIPELESKIKEIINLLIKDIQSCDAKQILDYFGAFYGLTTPDKIEEDLDSEKNFKLDYIHSLVSAVGNLNQKECSEEILNRIDKNIEDLKNNAALYLILTSDYKGEPSQIKFKQIIHNMIVRGDSYPEHKIEMCRELFSKFDDILTDRYGIDSKQLIDELINISEYPIKNLKIQKQYFDEIMLSYQEFIKNLEKISYDEEKIEFMQTYKDSENIKKVNEKLQNIYDKTGVSFNDSIFKIHKISLPKEILDALSMEIGDNKIYKEEEIEYFPTNDTLIYDKPLIKIDSEYYCFNPALIIYNLHTILENIIISIIPPKKHQKNYYKKKGEYLEDKSLELFQKILPNCEVYKSLKYGVDDEVDGIIIYDNNIFIVEAKSGKFSKGAKKGNVEKIKSNMKKLVEEAYNQTIRAKKYILSDEEVEFRDKSKKTVLKLKREKINNIYLINVTLEPLNHITANLSSLKEFGFIQNDEWIWSVYLNDLRIISEIIDLPSEFLVYVERRIKYNDYPQVKMAEEIDIFGYFLNEGLYFDDIEFPKNGFELIIDSSFSKDIDLYYFWKEGKLDKKVEKPTFFKGCKNNIKFLVKQIEELNKENFSILTKFLLSLDCYSQNLIKEQIELILKSQRTDFYPHIDKARIGVVFVSKRIYNYDLLKKQCELYAYERKINNWFVIILENNFIHFEQFYFDNKPNKIIENKFEGLKEYRLKQTLKVKRKIGRNELCPCGSGKKYKKCCGK